MKNSKSDSGQDILYIDHSNSASDTTVSLSTALPDNLASIMRNNVIIIKTIQAEVEEIDKNRTSKPVKNQ